MKLYSYVVVRDFGFAPNPFFGICTLATCKPEIRKQARAGDWIVGVSAKEKKRHRRIVYVMKVGEKITYDKYWNEQRFREKRPTLHASTMQAYGDNIYHRESTDAAWQQVASHHSNRDGSVNQNNLKHDTRVPWVLVGREFIYWGGEGPACPDEFCDTICAGGRPVRCNFQRDVVENFIAWIESLPERGRVGIPKDFMKVDAAQRRTRRRS